MLAIGEGSFRGGLDADASPARNGLADMDWIRQMFGETPSGANPSAPSDKLHAAAPSSVFDGAFTWVGRAITDMVKKQLEAFFRIGFARLGIDGVLASRASQELKFSFRIFFASRSSHL